MMTSKDFETIGRMVAGFILDRGGTLPTSLEDKVYIPLTTAAERAGVSVATIARNCAKMGITIRKPGGFDNSCRALTPDDADRVVAYTASYGYKRKAKN